MPDREPLTMLDFGEYEDDYLYFLESSDGHIHILSYQGLLYTVRYGNTDNIYDIWREKKDER